MQPMPVTADLMPAALVRPSMAPELRGLLNAVRLIAMECRAAARADLFQACAMLSNKEDTARHAHSRALLKCFREATTHQPRFFNPGTDEISFDESWLMQAVARVQADDLDSFEFLIRSRVGPIHQRNIAFLIKGVSEQFSQV